MQPAIRHQMWIILAALAVFFTNLGGPGLWDRDEPRNAGCAREMLERGDWVVPTFNEHLRAHKPVLTYWLMMSAYEVFGVNEFSARFWSALLGLGTALCTYHLGRTLFNAQVGLWGALILVTSLMFGVASRAATPDAPLIFCMTLALLLFARGSMRSLQTGGTAMPGDWKTFALTYAVMGLAVLAKGPIGVVLPTAAIGLYLLIVLPRDWVVPEADSLGARLVQWCRVVSPLRIVRTAWAMRPLTLLAMVCAVALPWYVLVGLQTNGEFLYEFLVNHNANRFASSMENHRGPFFYYAIALLVGMTPGSIWMGPTISQLVGRLRTRQDGYAGDVLLVCWAGVILVSFSLAGTKLPSYISPCYPAVALLIGRFIHAWITSPASIDRRWLPAALGVLALIGLGLCVGIPITARFVLPGEEFLGLIGLIPLGAALVCWRLAASQRYQQAMVTFAVAAVLLMTTAMSFVTQRVDRHQNDRPLMAAVQAASPKQAPKIAAFRHFRSTYVYYARQRVDEFTKKSEAADFLADPNAFLIVPESELSTIQAALPAETTVLYRRPRFLKSGDLLLLGTSRPEQTASRDARVPRR